MSWNLGASSSWNPQGLSRPVMGLLYLYLLYIHSCKESTSSFESCKNVFMEKFANDILIHLLIHGILHQLHVTGPSYPSITQLCCNYEILNCVASDLYSSSQLNILLNHCSWLLVDVCSGSNDSAGCTQGATPIRQCYGSAHDPHCGYWCRMLDAYHSSGSSVTGWNHCTSTSKHSLLFFEILKYAYHPNSYFSAYSKLL